MEYRGFRGRMMEIAQVELAAKDGCQGQLGPLHAGLEAISISMTVTMTLSSTIATIFATATAVITIISIIRMCEASRVCQHHAPGAKDFPIHVCMYDLPDGHGQSNGDMCHGRMIPMACWFVVGSKGILIPLQSM